MAAINPVPEVIGELKRTPYTMLSLVALILAVPYLWTHAARADDLQAIAGQVQAIQYSIKRSALEQQLRDISTELFNLRQKVSEMVAAKRIPDTIYYNRIIELENNKASAERELQATPR